jgi:DNA-binding HxlR family transcriptional regulator
MPDKSASTLSPGEMAIVEALVSGKKKWSDLKKETRLTPRWLSVSLNNLEEGEVVRRISEDSGKLSRSVYYELQEDFRREHEPTLKLLATLRSRIEWRHHDLRSIEGLMNAAMFGPPLYMFCALVATYYRQDELFRFLKSQATRHLDKVIESGCLLSSTLVHAHFKAEYGIDLTRMTFEQFARQTKPILDGLEEYSAG